MNTDTPILIADGIRGIHARTHAANTIARMIDAHTLRYSGHTVTRADIDIASDPTDEDNGEAWEMIAEGIYTIGDEPTEYRIHEDSEGIFLLPEGHEIEQPY